MDTINHSYEKRSLRPYILGICFVWGLFLGFIFYLNSESFAQVQKEQLKKEEEDRRIAEEEQRKKAKPVTKAPELKKIEAETAPTVAIDEITKPIDQSRFLPEGKTGQSLRPIPEPVELAMNPKWGLTGMTTYRPIKPVKLTKKAPKVDFSSQPKPSQPKKPVNINEIDLPEFND